MGTVDLFYGIPLKGAFGFVLNTYPPPVFKGVWHPKRGVEELEKKGSIECALEIKFILMKNAVFSVFSSIYKKTPYYSLHAPISYGCINSYRW